MRVPSGGPPSSTRSTVSVTTRTCWWPTTPTLARITFAAAWWDSTSMTSAAPRLAASRPRAPEPAQRSSTVAPWSSPRCSSRLKRASRTRSEVGRVDAPAGVWIRRPPATPLMMRVMSAALQPHGLLLVEAHRHGSRERRVPAQGGVAVDEREGVLAGIGDDLLVLEAPEPQVADRVATTALSGSEHVTLAPQQQVGPRELEAVRRRRDLVKSFGGPLPRPLRHEQAQSGHGATSDPAAQLVQL